MPLMPESAVKHIPAWKKLGLKLKFAKEDVDDGDGGGNIVRDSKKRKVSNGDGQFPVDIAATSRPAKQLKKVKTLKNNNTHTSSGDSFQRSQIESSPPVAVLVTPTTKRKSVSFTPETKTKDGDGVKQLYKTWLDRQIAHDPSFDPSTVSPALRAITPATFASDERAAHFRANSAVTSTSLLDHPPRRPKKRTLPKEAKHSRALQSTLPPTDHPALTYLQTYHTSPKIWKFSKPHQNYLLKHLFSHTHIPPSYDTALLSYLRGLQGSARSRVRQQALAIKTEDEGWLATEPAEEQRMDQETTAQCLARQKRDYDAAVARIKQRLREKEDEREEKEWDLLGDKEEWEKRVRKRRRAEVVLWGVGEEEEIVEDAIAAPKHAIFGNSRPAAGAQAVTIQSRGMGGVRQISNSGIAEGSAGKKIVFGDDGAKQVGTANGVQKPNDVDGAKKTEVKEGVKTKRKRKRKRRTGVPDDDSSSESSSSSEESEKEEEQAANGKVQYRRDGMDGSSESETSSSDSDSGSDSASR